MLTSFEEEMLNVCEDLRDAHSAGRPIHRKTHQQLVGRLRDVIVKLENKKYGCATGRHAGACACGKEAA